MKYVIDTSSLISLAKIQYLEIISALRIKVLLPHEVYDEAVTAGMGKGYTDSVIIENFIAGSVIKPIELADQHKKALRKKLQKILAAGDEAVLALAISEKADALVTNDDGLGRVAFALGISVQASSDLLLECLKRNILTFERYEILLRSLVIENRLSSAVAELYMLEGKKYVKS
jgi:predicted nucleic acid-binding protein